MNSKTEVNTTLFLPISMLLTDNLTGRATQTPLDGYSGGAGEEEA